MSASEREGALTAEDHAMKQRSKTLSISELAEFWQTHDLTDFEGELEEARSPVFQKADKVKGCLSGSCGINAKDSQ